MQVRPHHIKQFAKYTGPGLTDWLLKAMIATAKRSNDQDSKSTYAASPYSPHNFVDLAENPIEALLGVYKGSSIATKRKFHYAISKTATLCKPRSKEFAFTTNESLTLLNLFMELARQFLCFESSRYISSILDDIPVWKEIDGASVDETYALAFRASTELAMSVNGGFSVTAQSIRDLSNLLAALRFSPFFKIEYSPRLLTAMVSVAPSDLLNHLDIMGEPINTLHRIRPDQKVLAHRTARSLAKLSPAPLIQSFRELSFAHPTSRDRWLVDALFGDEGPWVFGGWVGKDGTKAFASRREADHSPFQIRSPDFVYYRPPRKQVEQVELASLLEDVRRGTTPMVHGEVQGRSAEGERTIANAQKLSSLMTNLRTLH